jgi:arylformamidase
MARGLPRDPFVGAVPISGVFELAPLLRTSMNSEIRLNAEQAREWSLHEKLPVVKCPVDFVVGTDESNEFHRQSRYQCELWREISRSVVLVRGKNHYDVIEELGEPGSKLFSIVDAMVGR